MHLCLPCLQVWQHSLNPSPPDVGGLYANRALTLICLWGPLWPLGCLFYCPLRMQRQVQPLHLLQGNHQEHLSRSPNSHCRAKGIIYTNTWKFKAWFSIFLTCRIWSGLKLQMWIYLLGKIVIWTHNLHQLFSSNICFINQKYCINLVALVKKHNIFAWQGIFFFLSVARKIWEKRKKNIKRNYKRCYIKIRDN